VPRGLQGQSRLADAPGATQADQPMFRGQVCDLSEFGVSPDQFRNRLREVRHPRGRRTTGRGRCCAEDLGRQAVFLDDPVRPHAAHECVFAEDRAASVDEGQERIESPTSQLERSAIGQQLPAVAHDLEPAKFNSDGIFG